MKKPLGLLARFLGALFALGLEGSDTLDGKGKTLLLDKLLNLLTSLKLRRGDRVNNLLVGESHYVLLEPHWLPLSSKRTLTEEGETTKPLTHLGLEALSLVLLELF
jgi:hypothetical protein